MNLGYEPETGYSRVDSRSTGYTGRSSFRRIRGRSSRANFHNFSGSYARA